MRTEDLPAKVTQDTDRPGKVTTFYSYKGGTGRSMALANVACVLARRQNTDKGILMIDWDLEAPGLHRYFRTQLKRALGSTDDRALDEHPGLIDLFWELNTKLQPQNGNPRTIVEEDDAIALFEEINLRRFILDTDIPGLSLLKAGQFNDSYASRVNTFPWETLYLRAPLLLRVFAETLAEQYCHVLIDSRTGLTDISGICTMLLPEKLVVVFTPNRQSLTGLLGLVQRATDYRRQSEDLRPLVVFPLASRIEPTKNTLRHYWRKGKADEDIIGYQSQFEQMFQKVYNLKDCHLDIYFNHALIQHVPSYAYGENIAVLSQRRGENLLLAQRYETFAQLLVDTRAPWDRAVTAAVAENGQLIRYEESPYRALLPFQEAHEEFFFGRQEVAEQLQQRLVQIDQPFLVVDGPSGSGKTSLLQAGVIPKLRRERPTWTVLVVQLGTDPFITLQRQMFAHAEQDPVVALPLVHTVSHWLKMHPTQHRLVLILDQFETVLLNSERERYLTQLEEALSANLPLTVVVAMRNDFKPVLSQYLPPSLLEIWWKADNTFSLPTTLDRDTLHEIVCEPAAGAGLAFQDGLIETIVDNAIDIAPTMVEYGRAAQSTVLPLLEHALHEMWQRRTEGFLTHEAYHAMGELTGKLPQLAEAMFKQLSTDERSIAQRVLTQLVQVRDTSLGIDDTWQRRFLTDLSLSKERSNTTLQVIEKLASARLVVTTVTEDRATVEIIHNALLNWPRFQQWLNNDRPFLLWKRRLRLAITEWERIKEDESALLQGPALVEAEEFLKSRAESLGQDERDFIAASQAQRRSRLDEQLQRQSASSGAYAGNGYIAYTREDVVFVRQLTQALKDRAVEIWVDLEGLPVAEEYWSRINRAIEKATFFIFVMSPDSIASPLCRRELDVAVQLGKRIVPIYYRPVDEKQIPEQLAVRQWTFFREEDDFTVAFQSLMNTISSGAGWERGHVHWLVRAKDWYDRGRDRSLLLRGRELEEAEAWLMQAPAEEERRPTPLQAQYVMASRRDERRRRRRQMTLAVSTITVLLALVALLLMR